MMDRPFLLQPSLLVGIMQAVAGASPHRNCQKVSQRLYRQCLFLSRPVTRLEPRKVKMPSRTRLLRGDISMLPQIRQDFKRVDLRAILNYRCFVSNSYQQYSLRRILSTGRWPWYFQSRNFMETCNNGHESADEKTRTVEGLSYLEARRQGLLPRRRSLSPTERLDQMLGSSPGHEGSSSGQDRNEDTVESESESSAPKDEDGVTRLELNRAASDDHLRGLDEGRVDLSKPFKLGSDPPMVDGEMVLAVKENFKRHEYLYRMFKLSAGTDFCSKFGTISHADVVGHPAGKTFTTDLGIDVLIRRPSLEEFVLYMKRTPVISYPKDCCTMLMMIDASPGDVILEAGTGSGAMTLFLSRAVGPEGCVHTFDARPEHVKRAIKNVKKWVSSWNISHPHQPWPENVCFHSGKLQSCDKDFDPALLVDGAVIDMERPCDALPTLAARLKSGKTAALYIANITQLPRTQRTSPLPTYKTTH
ncbi:uncharacterized protein LOC110981985 isoform X2 [Acanthaster planci]|uniref:tRNA (adenine(58)-N(1))-methyltransferase n=1 Tax=Acanthaster planci TaxID=133434 RepID=A0A8B7YWV5_ACAPL|nr:uncharacterized protein LOC110981985 isoform X2 [Acanthaster planci]